MHGRIYCIGPTTYTFLLSCYLLDFVFTPLDFSLFKRTEQGCCWSLLRFQSSVGNTIEKFANLKWVLVEKIFLLSINTVKTWFDFRGRTAAMKRPLTCYCETLVTKYPYSVHVAIKYWHWKSFSSNLSSQTSILFFPSPKDGRWLKKAKSVPTVGVCTKAFLRKVFRVSVVFRMKIFWFKAGSGRG